MSMPVLGSNKVRVDKLENKQIMRHDEKGKKWIGRVT